MEILLRNYYMKMRKYCIFLFINIYKDNFILELEIYLIKEKNREKDIILIFL